MTTPLSTFLSQASQSLDPGRIANTVNQFDQMRQRNEQREVTEKAWNDHLERMETDAGYKKIASQVGRNFPLADVSNPQQLQQMLKTISAAQDVKGSVGQLLEAEIIDSEVAEMFESMLVKNPEKLSGVMVTLAQGHMSKVEKENLKKEAYDDAIKTIRSMGLDDQTTKILELNASLDPKQAVSQGHQRLMDLGRMNSKGQLSPAAVAEQFKNEEFVRDFIHDNEIQADNLKELKLEIRERLIDIYGENVLSEPDLNNIINNMNYNQETKSKDDGKQREFQQSLVLTLEKAGRVNSTFDTERLVGDDRSDTILVPGVGRVLGFFPQDPTFLGEKSYTDGVVEYKLDPKTGQNSARIGGIQRKKMPNGEYQYTEFLPGGRSRNLDKDQMALLAAREHLYEENGTLDPAKLKAHKKGVVDQVKKWADYTKNIIDEGTFSSEDQRQRMMVAYQKARVLHKNLFSDLGTISEPVSLRSSGLTYSDFKRKKEDAAKERARRKQKFSKRADTSVYLGEAIVDLNDLMLEFHEAMALNQDVRPR